MASNVAITPGAGATISTEEVTTLNGGAVSAQQAQRVILALRTAAGTAVDLVGGSSGSLKIEGNVASLATDSGAPVKIGGVYVPGSGGPAGAASGQRVDLWSGYHGSLSVNAAYTSSSVDGFANAQGIQLRSGDNDGAYGQMEARFSSFNGATWDRARANIDVTLLASAARTTTTASPDQTNYNSRGLQVVLDVTLPGTGSITLTIQGKDSVSGNYYTILAGVAVTTTSTTVYRVYPGLLAAVNAIANDILPRTWRVNVVANNANAITYSVGASVIL